jgi:polyisoprenyl-teichoic acid--peptidoglycan teichoic acid transferase
MYKKIALLSSLLLITVACVVPFSTQPAAAIQQTVSTSAPLVATNDPNATITPTPFQPLAPTPTFTSTPLPTPTPEFTATAEISNTGPVSSNLPRPDGQVNILILGSDYRTGKGFRTDTMMLVSLYTKQGTAAVVSFPRDLWVYIPGTGNQRINVAQEYGGFNLTQQTFAYNFSVKPDHYILTTFSGFINIINTLGGVDVEASKNVTDTCKLPQAQNGYCSFGPGTIHMDGTTALWYARSRHSTSDLDRGRRQQEIMLAVFKKLMSMDAIKRAPEMFSMLSSSIETDLSLTDLIQIAAIAPSLLQPGHIRNYAMGSKEVSGYVVPGSGAQVLLPKKDAIMQIIREYFYNP